MKVAIDAKWYHRGPAGVHTYIRNLLDELRLIRSDLEAVAFVRPHDPVPETTGSWRWQTLRPELSAPRVWWALPRAVRRSPVDLFFTQSLAPRSRRAPRCMTVHDVLWHDYPEHFTWRERMHFRLIDRDIRHAEIIITDSEHSRERICATSGRAGSDVRVIPLGVSGRFRPLPAEADRSALRAELHLPGRFLLYVGRINRRKNLPNLFRALTMLPEPLDLVCAGTRDWLQDDLGRMLRDLHLESRVHFLGRVSDDALPVICALADVFVYVPFAEGFGIPPLEAMASGTPVVASDATSLPEVVGDAGLLVPPGDPQAIAEAVGRLLTEGDLREAVRERGLARARQFTWRQAAEKTLALWEEIV